jgi:hypothetical protein
VPDAGNASLPGDDVNGRAPTSLGRPKVALLYAVSIVASCIGEGWAYYLLGSAVEIVLLAAIVRMASAWPKAAAVPSPQLAKQGAAFSMRKEPVA